MEVRDSAFGKGLFATKKYTQDEILFFLEGPISSFPTRETIHIGRNRHICDDYGIYINHSFTPTIFINHIAVVALRNIEIGEELVFNYNENEINMASPFYVENILVSGKESYFF